MQKILIYSNCTEFIEYTTVLLEGQLDIEVISMSANEDFFRDIALLKEMFLIITDVNLDHGNGKMIRETNKLELRLPFIYIFNEEEEHKEEFFDEFFAENFLNRSIAKLMIKKKLLMALEEIIHYKELDKLFREEENIYDGKSLYKISAKLFLDKKTTTGDVFVKLQNGKFIKVIRAKDDINYETIENIIAKGQNYLYQDTESYNDFLENKLNNLQKSLDLKDIQVSQKIQLQLKSIKEVQDAVRLMGVSDMAIELTEKVVESVDELIKKNKNLKPLVKNMLSYRSSFFTRSSILNYLLGALTSKIGWNTQSILRKLVFTSVFCDFAFTSEQESLAMVRDLSNSENIENLSKQEIKIIEKHPELAAIKLESKSRGMLIDESMLIRQHHEKPDGTGFPKGLNNKTIPPMSAAFILCYDFVQLLIENCEKPEDIDSEAIFKQLGESYRTGNFEKPYMALRQALKFQF
jgi:hypothetical protein